MEFLKHARVGRTVKVEDSSQLKAGNYIIKSIENFKDAQDVVLVLSDGDKDVTINLSVTSVELKLVIPDSSRNNYDQLVGHVERFIDVCKKEGLLKVNGRGEVQEINFNLLNPYSRFRERRSLNVTKDGISELAEICVEINIALEKEAFLAKRIDELLRRIQGQIAQNLLPADKIWVKRLFKRYELLKNVLGSSMFRSSLPTQNQWVLYLKLRELEQEIGEKIERLAG